jgi:hypothetical protein
MKIEAVWRRKWFVFVGVQEATPLMLKRPDGSKRILDYIYSKRWKARYAWRRGGMR